MHFTSLACFKMATTGLGEESSRIAKRKKTRRGRRWRNVQERRKFIDEYMKQRKHRVAPSNTTQFLMEDREKIEPILNLSPSSSISSLTSADGNEDVELDIDAELDNFNEQFFLKDFETTYRQLYRDNLHSLTIVELSQKVKDLQCHRDSLETEKQSCFGSSTSNNQMEAEPINALSDSLTKEFLQLQKENDLLREENKVLKETSLKE